MFKTNIGAANCSRCGGGDGNCNVCRDEPEPSQKPARKSQNDLILDVLTRNAGEWVSMITLYNVSGSLNVSSRIDDLRNRGHNIENRIEYKGMNKHSFYKINTLKP